MAELPVRQFRKILLIKPSSLGDCIHALPVLNALNKSLPEAEIFWLINSEYADLLSSHPGLAGLIFFRRSLFRARQLGYPTLAETWRLWRRLRAERFDLTIDLQGLFRSAAMSLASGARYRFGLPGAREFAGLFYTHQVRFDPGDVHAVDRYLRSLESFGISQGEPDFSLPVASTALSEVQQMLSASGLDERKEFVLVVPGARWQSKRWPIERFAAVIDGIRTELSLPSVLAGSAGEVELCRELAGLCHSRPLNLAGRTSLAQLIALIGTCRLVLGHDSGAIHLAHALVRPLVCLVGPTDPSKTGPYGGIDSVVRAGVPCAPCRRTVCPDNRCMTLMGPAEVLAKVEAILSSGAG